IEGFEKLIGEINLEDKKARFNKKNSVLIYLNIGLSYMMMKDYDKAIEYFEKGFTIDKGFGSLVAAFNLATDRKKRDEVHASL
ncbi:MAG: tetratricopeptide repeat protein, partial [Bacteroidales bacterium]|nr:tetratricopeptide repeat protein [Bacteroidales bacterium]